MAARHPRRQPLPPLEQRATRTRLLAWTYLDACIAGQDDTTGGRPASRRPGRYDELWQHGSYPELERALNTLRFADNHAYRLIGQRYIDVPILDQPNGGRALHELTSLMPRTIHVPAEVSLAAGYLEGEAHRYHRKRQSDQP